MNTDYQCMVYDVDSDIFHDKIYESLLGSLYFTYEKDIGLGEEQLYANNKVESARTFDRNVNGPVSAAVHT